MKTIYKIFSIIIGGMLTFVTCSDEDIKREPSPEVLSGCQGVFFPATASAFELEIGRAHV